MRARFFYGWGEEITFKDRLSDGSEPLTEHEKVKVERFLTKIRAKMGFYQIDGTDISSLVLLQDCTRKDEGEYEEWCPHCGCCTLYNTTTESIQCMWCGEDLLPCSMCREYWSGKCDFGENPHKCINYIGKNRVPNFSTCWDED